MTSVGKKGMRTRVLRGEIAQLVEQGTENPRVIGSIPILATIFLPAQTLTGVKVRGFVFARFVKEAKTTKTMFEGKSEFRRKRGERPVKDVSPFPPG